jgi:hypothetical protein
MRYLETCAVRWLSRRGYVVLAQPFVGMCLGFATADRVESNETHSAYMVVIPKGAPVIALNNTLINRHAP